jgi:hypothetical protein
MSHSNRGEHIMFLVNPSQTALPLAGEISPISKKSIAIVAFNIFAVQAKEID